jgi:hypothetical protein
MKLAENSKSGEKVGYLFLSGYLTLRSTGANGDGVAIYSLVVSVFTIGPARAVAVGSGLNEASIRSLPQSLGILNFTA